MTYVCTHAQAFMHTLYLGGRAKLSLLLNMCHTFTPVKFHWALCWPLTVEEPTSVPMAWAQGISTAEKVLHLLLEKPSGHFGRGVCTHNSLLSLRLLLGLLWRFVLWPLALTLDTQASIPGLPFASCSCPLGDHTQNIFLISLCIC